MRTLVDIPDADWQALAEIGRAKALSQDGVIREAVTQYLAAAEPQAPEARPTEKKPNFSESFGLWGDRVIDGVEYQRRLRDEW